MVLYSLFISHGLMGCYRKVIVANGTCFSCHYCNGEVADVEVKIKVCMYGLSARTKKRRLTRGGWWPLMEVML